MHIPYITPHQNMMIVYKLTVIYFQVLTKRTLNSGKDFQWIMVHHTFWIKRTFFIEGSNFLECYIVLMCRQFQTFQRIIVPSSSLPSNTRQIDHEYEGTKIVICLLNNTTQLLSQMTWTFRNSAVRTSNPTSFQTVV